MIACPVRDEDDEPYETHLVVEERFSLSDVVEGDVVPMAECIIEANAHEIVRLLNLWKN